MTVDYWSYSAISSCELFSYTRLTIVWFFGWSGHDRSKSPSGISKDSARGVQNNTRACTRVCVCLDVASPSLPSSFTVYGQEFTECWLRQKKSALRGLDWREYIGDQQRCIETTLMHEETFLQHRVRLKVSQISPWRTTESEDSGFAPGTRGSEQLKTTKTSGFFFSIYIETRTFSNWIFAILYQKLISRWNESTFSTCRLCETG